MCEYCENKKEVRSITFNGDTSICIFENELYVDGDIVFKISHCPMCRKEAGREIKEFCDICKVEIDNQNVLAIVSTPVKTYKVCKECLDDLIQHIQNKENNFKLESKRYERDYNKKWNEIC